jgi:hypothetical protein
MMTYRVKDWEEHFEVNRTRPLKKMSWIPLPNKQDGDGYTVLVQHENGAAQLGAWIAILQVASKCNPRGTLGRSNGKAHTAQSLARITRLPAELLHEVIGRLVSPDIAWLEVVDGQDLGEIPQDGAGIPQVPAGIPQDGVSTLQDITEKGEQDKEGQISPPVNQNPLLLNEIEMCWSTFSTRYKGHPPVTRRQFGERLSTLYATGKTTEQIQDWVRDHTLSAELKPWQVGGEGAGGQEQIPKGLANLAAVAARKQKEVAL